MSSCGRKVILLIVLINLLIVSGAFLNNNESNMCNINQIYSSEANLKVALIINECLNVTSVSWTYINSAIWTIDRLNSLNFTSPFNLGLSIFQACTENDYYDSVYKLFKQEDEGYFLGALSNNPVSAKIHQFSDVLGVHLITTDKYRNGLLEATVKLLAALDLSENITVYAENQAILQEFYKHTRKYFLCIKSGVKLEKHSTRLVKPHSGPVVVLAGHDAIKDLLNNVTFEEKLGQNQIIFAPLDVSESNDFPEGSYVILPTFTENEFDMENSTKLFPSPLLFDVANPILNMVLNITYFINENCNETLYKLNCLRAKFPKITERSRLKFTPSQILNLLKIEPLAETFLYRIYRVENVTVQNQEANATFDNEPPSSNTFQSFVNVFTYSIFNDTLINLEVNDLQEEINVTSTYNFCTNCTSGCLNFEAKQLPKTILISYAFKKFGLRSESWVFAFLATSILGVVFCIAVLVFLTVRFCKRDILEGNPFLTILLLLSVVLMYCSVIPYTLESDKELKYYICLARALSTTLTYAFAFSLLLSRSILLATVSKEVGFMSHVPGPVQSFLTLFIFGVQGAISLQFLNHCEDIFRGTSFVYLMSYNIILLILLVFICPLNMRAQRNYKEGRHFTVAVVLMACCWCCWVPGYALLEDEWKDSILCLGLVSTASILLGAIFIPRTYLMTIAAARDRITNTLPSIPATSSIMDVYRASTQPVYDCINIAAINARNIPIAPPQSDIYSTLPLPYDEEFDFERSITPTPDKVTRF